MRNPTARPPAIAVADGDDHSYRVIARAATGWAVLRVTGLKDARAVLQDDAVWMICAGADDGLGMGLLVRAQKDRPGLTRVLLVPPADGALLVRWVNQARPFGVLAKPLDDERVHELLSELQRDEAADPRSVASASTGPERDWEQTFDAIRMPIAIVGAGFSLLRINRAGAELRGEDRAHIAGRRCHSVLFGRAEPCNGCPVGSLGDSTRHAHAEISSEKTTFRVHAHRADSGFAVCCYVDLAEEKRRLTRAVEAEKLSALGQLAAGIAHQINNPVANILAFAELLKAGPPLDADQTNMLASIEASALRCKRIIASMLQLWGRDAQKKPLRLTECVHEAISLFRTEVESRPQLALQVEVPPALPSVLGNAGQLQQVFLHLLQNAMQAIPDEGTISVSAGVADAGRVFVRVADTGGGIEPEHLPHIFKPTFTTRPPGVGTGFGLAIAQAIIHEHGGVIDVETRAGRGTAMTVLLPIHDDV